MRKCKKYTFYPPKFANATKANEKKKPIKKRNYNRLSGGF